MGYILVSASLRDLAREVNARIAEGYEAVGGPHPGDSRSMQPHWIQAMFKKPTVGVQAPAVGERGDPPAREDQGEQGPKNHTAHTSSGNARAELDLNLVLRSDPERIHTMHWGDVELMIEASRRLFAKRVNKLREIQQTPYSDYVTPKDSKEALEFLRNNDRIGNLILEEIFAAQRSRDPSVGPLVYLKRSDAVLIGDLLTLNANVQYPTDAQQAVLAFLKQLESYRGVA